MATVFGRSLLLLALGTTHGLAVAPSLPSLRRAAAPRIAAAKIAAPRHAPPRAVAAEAAAAAVLGPRWLSLLPPLVTLGASVAMRQVVLAMLLGIWSGALLLNEGNPLIAGMRTFDYYFVGAFISAEHAGVVLFTLLLGGTIGLVQKSGGALGLANLVRGLFTSRRSGSLSTMGLGSLLFFDDYSSILIVGNSLRPLVAAVGLSAAKFAYIAHVMGVVLASLAPLSSWVGLQIGYIGGAYEQLAALPAVGGGAAAALATADPFLGFVRTIPYRFFPLSILAFLIAGALSGKDFGPMLDEEKRAVTIGGGGGVAAMEAEAAEEAEAAAGELDPKPGTPLRAVNALLPFGVVMVTAFCGMVYQGQVAIAALPASQAVEPTLVNCLRFADSVAALIWGSAAGWLASLGCVLGQRLLSLGEAMEAWTAGTKEVLEPVFVLLLAWALGAVIADVGTAEFLASALQGGLPAWSLPALISVICFAISFACGSSFGTCGIVFPLVGPLAWQLSGGDMGFLHQCFGAIFGASTFGNICSPISDTSILTVLATRCDLATHIRTILPYAALAGVVSLVFGDLAVGLGLYGPTAALAACAAVLATFKLVVGRKADEVEAAPAVPTEVA